MSVRRLLIAIVACSVALVSCGGTTETETTTTTSTAPPTTTTTLAPSTTTTTTTTPAPAVPEWAADILDAEEYARFVELVEGYFSDGGVFADVDFEAGAIYPEGTTVQLGLFTLAQRLATSDAADWPEIVRVHFDNSLAALADDDELPRDWAEAAPTLRVRLYDELFFEALGDAGASKFRREVVRGVYATVVYDTPEAVRPIDVDELEPWDVNEDVVFDTALANTFADPDLLVEEFELDDGTPLISVGGSFFSTTFVIDLESTVDDLGDAGALVIMPVRENAIVHRIVDSSARHAFDVLAVIAAGWYADGPGSLSPFVYWWRDGELLELGFLVEGAGSSMQAGVGQEFLDLLDTLP